MTDAVKAPGPGRGLAAAAWGLNVLGALIGGWAFVEFDPIPTSLVACVVAPFVAVGLAAAWPGAFTLFGGGPGGGRGLAGLFLLPFVGLIFRAAFTVELLHLSADLVPAVLGAAAGAAGAALWIRRFHRGRRAWPLPALLGALVACAVFEEVDTRFDHSPPQHFRVPVTGAYATRRRTTSYYVSLPAWGPRQEPDSVRVSADVYNGVRPGQEVCVVLHAGALGAPWYSVVLCPGPAAAAAS
ncbi:MAG TPA: hypothetical protein VMT68_14435 [Caulobacteraceae bacterium]|nr:hypothetical protein [Caulobacteraceae bacterium]